MKRIVILLLLTLFAAASAQAQYPRPKGRPLSVFDVGQHLMDARFNRVVVVDSAGGGDFRRLGTGTGDWKVTGGALDYVASIPDGGGGPCSVEPWTRKPCRNWSNQWLVLVNPGRGGSTDPNVFGAPYSEVSLQIPAYTVIEGINAGHNSPVFMGLGGPVVILTGTSGSLVKTKAGSGIVGMSFFWVGAPTGYLRMLEVTGPDYLAVLTNVAFGLSATGAGASVCAANGQGSGASPCATDGVVVSAGGAYLYSVSVDITGNALGRALVNNDPLLGVSLYGGRWEGSSGCAKLIENAAAGPVALYEGVRLGTGALGGGGACSTTLVNSGAGTLQVVGGVTYVSSTGTITNAPLHASSITLDTGCKILSGSGTPEGAVAAPVCSLFLRTDGSTTTTLYVKTTGAGNTGWTAK